MDTLSRTNRTWISAAFGYSQTAMGLITGLVLVPVILAYVDTDQYGLWLASGELIGYAGLADFGVLNVLPFIIAQHDGRRDRDSIRRTLVNSIVVGCATSVLFASAALLFWVTLSATVEMDAHQRQSLIGPLVVVLICQAIAYPLMAFQALVVGVQDAQGFGAISLASRFVRVAVTIALLWSGLGLYALALGTSASLILGPLSCLIRSIWIAPDLFSSWKMPDIEGLWHLFREGIGSWLGSIGWRLSAASTSLIIVMINTPEGAVIFSCTAKAAIILMPLIWQLTDAGMIGLAQLYGEANLKRSSEVAQIMIRATFFAAGGGVFMLLLFNHIAVGVWVGQEFFGGAVLNVAIALTLLTQSIVHVLNGIVSALKYRLFIGLATLINGGLFVLLALGLGHSIGLSGIALATILSDVCWMIPVGLVLLKHCFSISLIAITRNSVLPWLARGAPLLAGAAVICLSVQGMPMWAAAAFAPLAGLFYLVVNRSLIAGIPVPARLQPVVRLRVLRPFFGNSVPFSSAPAE